MPFFDYVDSNKEIFEESCKQFIYSRGLAQIKPETLNAIQENFEKRCEELLIIKSSIPAEPEQKSKYIERYNTLWKLFDYIDLDRKKIIYHEGDSPTTLIHLFADKIVKSFLTEDFRIVSSYE
ncbi:hypothetical protein Desaci_1232 [Desulfosporosinus acidiphilus SJ4]|uniref:Uncharacterized protein n=2 Tax=Desulfosporosinus TaxID=79206 RepID=I4D388_DESAJ|nr:hypothetical protein Desaci_1232 [Desulfosporosinus acidiphilus SJ4]